MRKLVIDGGKKFSGILEVSGSKNSALPILVAVLIEKGEYDLKNIPDLSDIKTLIELLENHGLIVEKKSKNHYKIINKGIKNIVAPYEIVSKMRASFLVLGAILANKKKAKVSLPGGCAIGSRPVDLHLKSLEKLGAKIKIEHGYVEAEAEKLHGAEIKLDIASVGATEHIILVAVKAEGITKIINAAREPEIIDLCNFLNKMGAKITGGGESEIKIEGVKKLNPSSYSIIYDRIEAGTFIILSLITGTKIKIKNVFPEHLKGFIDILNKMGVIFEIKNNLFEIKSDLKRLKAVKFNTDFFPGFPTDLQAQMMVLLSLVSGKSEITEKIFENRFMHIPELNRLGAKIKIDGQTAIIEGSCKFAGAEVMATDLRAGAALFLAASVAEGKTVINNIEHIERGYENIVKKLKKIGVKIKII
ncbi:MAG: UDP-N-acetylglucosamine 1-carboxyvinyltransferase [Patescibacteria group bacterium]